MPQDTATSLRFTTAEEDRMIDRASTADEQILAEAVKLLRESAYQLWLASLCAGPKHLADLFAELKDPKPGDLVMETSTFYMKSHNPLEGIGVLEGVGQAPYFKTREQARAAGYKDDEALPTRLVWDLRLIFDGNRPFRWENASFIKVKTSEALSPAVCHKSAPAVK